MTIKIESLDPKNNTINVSSLEHRTNSIVVSGNERKNNNITVNTIISTKGESSFYIVCDNIQERDLISSDKRGLGLFAYVIANDNIYQLQGGLSNSDWVLLTKPYASVGMFNAPTNPIEGSLYFDLSQNALKIFMFGNWQEIPSLEKIIQLLNIHDNDINAHKALFDISKNLWKSIL